MQKIDPEVNRNTVSMEEEDVGAHFAKHFKIFNPHSFINFVTGFILTYQEFAKFTQDEHLNSREFEAGLGTYDRGYGVSNNLLVKEKDARLNL